MAKPARENVVREIGLFQGRLGFNRAIILLEAGCSRFSNIDGPTYIPFAKGDMRTAWEEIRKVLEREGLVRNAAAASMWTREQSRRPTPFPADSFNLRALVPDPMNVASLTPACFQCLAASPMAGFEVTTYGRF